MKNILIVCADKDLRKDISRVLAKELNFLYVDVDDVLEFELLNQQDVALKDANDVMRQLETKSINRVLEFDKCIITISRDAFVANDNFRRFDNLIKVFVSLSKAYFVARAKGEDKLRLEQELALFDQINKLIGVNCHFVVEKEVKSIEEISGEIIKNLKPSRV